MNSHVWLCSFSGLHHPCTDRNSKWRSHSIKQKLVVSAWLLTMHFLVRAFWFLSCEKRIALGLLFTQASVNCLPSCSCLHTLSLFSRFRSVSFIFATGGMAFLLLTFCYLTIDVLGWWSGTPFRYPGKHYNISSFVRMQVPCTDCCIITVNGHR